MVLLRNAGSAFATRATALCGSTSSGRNSEVELHTDTRDARRKNRRGLAEHGEAGIFRQDRIRIEHVVDIQIHLRPGAAKSQDLAETQIELIPPVPVQSARWDDDDGDVRPAA